MATTSHDAWRGFRGTGWRETIDVGGFIHDNIEPYAGGPEFLTGPTHRTERIWRQLQRMRVFFEDCSQNREAVLFTVKLAGAAAKSA